MNLKGKIVSLVCPGASRVRLFRRVRYFCLCLRNRGWRRANKLGSRNSSHWYSCGWRRVNNCSPWILESVAGHKPHCPGERPSCAACGGALRLAERLRLLGQYTTWIAFQLVVLGIGHSATFPLRGGGWTLLRPLPTAPVKSAYRQHPFFAVWLASLRHAIR